MAEYRELSTLHNWSDNPRAIKEDRFQELKHRLQEYGEIKPLIVTDDGEVLGGNMRLRAMKELGFTKAWVSVVHPKTEADKVKIALTDNEEMGYYEDQALAELIEKYKGEIDLTKYAVHLGDPINLDELLAKFGPEPEEDECPEVSDEPAVSVLGEVYQLGRHRVMCGDSTKIEDVEKLMDGKKADMVFTDPPYGVDYDGGHKEWEVIENDGHNEFEEILNNALSNCLLVTKKGAGWYIWHASNTSDEFYKAVKSIGKKPSAQIVWVKNNMAGGFGDYRGKHEPCIYVHGQFYGGRDQHTVWEVSKEINYQHPTQKPVELGVRAIKNSSKQEDIIIDLFLGSGSTLIACEQTNRTCYGMELDCRYLDVIRKRYWKFTHDNNEDGWEKGTPSVIGK